MNIYFPLTLSPLGSRTLFFPKIFFFFFKSPFYGTRNFMARENPLTQIILSLTF